MTFRASHLAVCLALLAPMAMSAEPAPDKEAPLAFQFSLPEEKEGEAAKIPFFRVFPGGRDKNGKDASSTLSTLKLARGESKLYAAEDAKPGLIVLLRRLVLVPLRDGDYQAILEGEFNAVQTRLPKATMERLLAGETTNLVFESETRKGVRPLAFKVEATTKLRAALRDGVLLCYGGEGGATITHYGLLRAHTFESPPVSLGPENNTGPVYIGHPVKPVLKSDGSPETLPIIN
jgi:hypothetical protein